ncbi:hypothetical protein XA68_18125 [Ophiocordyceps unilateralis]|uniref:Uncharacterized protein n=1 Tax=Ophiocordyceps unilateralis TaxID=268505 RepID=A0A2A9P3I5_OPHUN|nr:hypothetical protein XA68_18125 [Ophiocordyceps unilateralis]
MVSFFGIKFKEGRKSQKPLTQPRVSKTEQTIPSRGQQPACNFSRPQTQAARSVTSQSRKAAPSAPAWRAVFGNPGASSSDADLPPPPAMGKLRRNASDLNLYASRAAQAAPLPSISGLRPGTPSRPFSRKAEWVNPLDVHFCRDPDPAPMSRAALQKLDTDAKGQADVGRDGCPSPPNSDRNRSYVAYHPSIGRVSQDSSGNRCNGRMEAPTATSLPSPAPSSPVTSDDDQPTPQAKLHQREGFVGNFSDFDFGDGVSKPAACTVGGAASSDRPATPGLDAPVSTFETPRAAAPSQSFSARVDSMANSRRARPPRPLDTAQSAEGTAATAESPILPRDTPRRPVEHPQSSPFSLRPMEGDFPVSKGLPRGRRPGPPTSPASVVDVEAEADKSWPTFNHVDVRQSAVPPPLSTSSSRTPSGSGASDSASTQRVASPEFSSGATSFTSSSDDLVRSFELALEESLGGGLFSTSDTMADIGAGLGKGSCGGMKSVAEPVRRTGYI